MEIIKDIILINAYWFSLPLIGYVILHIFSRKNYFSRWGMSNVASGVLRQNGLISALVSFGVAAAIFSVVSLILYLINAPVLAMTTIYILLLVGSVGYLAFNIGKRLFTRVDFNLFHIKDETLLVKLLFFALLCLLVVDFCIALYVKSYALVSADTYVHLSRIVNIVNQGFTVDSGFFRGLGEAGYHYNVIYSLYAVGSQILHLEPFRVWEYSFAFFRLMQWLGVFTLGWYVFKFILKMGTKSYFMTILATIFAIISFSPLFFVAMYPNQIVNIWIVLLIINLSLYELRVGGMTIPAVLLAILTTMTHPTYSFMSAMFVGLVLLARLIIEKRSLFKERGPLLFYGIIMGILMLGPVRTLLFPSRMNSGQVEIGSFPTWDFFGLSMKAPINVFPTDALGIAITGISLLAVGYLGYKLLGNVRQFIIFIGLALFYPLIVFMPIVFTILHSVLPMWVLDRFNTMNILVYLFIPIGLYCAYLIFSSLLERKANLSNKARLYLEKGGYIFIIVSVGLFALLALPKSYTSLRATIGENAHYYNFMSNTHDNFKNILNQDKVVVADQGDSYFLASILPVDVIAIEAGHMTPTADATNRVACQAHILDSFNYQDLVATRSEYVVIAKYSPHLSEQLSVIKSKPYLDLVTIDANFYIYKFNRLDDNTLPNSRTVYRPCVEYKNNESH